MVEKHNIGQYNETIANASNSIGQKLFAYIANGKNINDRIREKFKKSLIFIGDEGQIYNPLTNTYVGIGQTAYTSTISYIEDAHEKIDALQKMLASSMVSAIYANWSKNDWDEALASNATGTKWRNPVENASTYFPNKIYATNEIVLKGNGDYDPATHLAASREYSHISDNNEGIAQETKDIYNKVYKVKSPAVVKEYKYTNNASDTRELTAGISVDAGETYTTTDDISAPAGFSKETVYENQVNAFATSGITVSLERGENRYLYSYTITKRQPANEKLMYCFGGEPDNEPYSKEIKIYLTESEYNDFIGNHYSGTVIYNSATGEYSFSGGDFIDVIDKDSIDENGNLLTLIDASVGNDIVKNALITFYRGLKAQYNDGYVEKSGDEYKEINKKNQLFKQSANVLTIDDKLTWSYIANAYTYTLNFSKDYTDKQVQRIYHELLGEESALIPASWEQARVLVPNNLAQLDSDKAVWDDVNCYWKTGTDDVFESTNTLGKYVLDYSSTFVVEYTMNGENITTLKYDEVNDNATIADGKTDQTVLPWSMLKDLAQKIAEHKEAIIDECNEYSYSHNGVVDVYDALKNGINTVKGIEQWVNEEYTYTIGETTYAFASYAGTGVTKLSKDLDDVWFMTFDTTAASEHDHENFDRDVTFKQSIGDSTLPSGEDGYYGATAENGKYGAGDPGDPPRTYGYTSKNYTLKTVYKVVTFDKLMELTELGTEFVYNDNNDVFVVNTMHINNKSFNLADGIQTLKEVAYVLDIITDGWGNQFDPEGNGILLTYTIANNHERIEDHEKRLRDLEGGTNIVKAIYKDRNSMSKYVNLHLQSDTSWKGANVETINEDDKDTATFADAHFAQGNYIDGDNNFITHTALDESIEWHGIFSFESKDAVPAEYTDYVFAIPQSYIYAYNIQLSAYWSHYQKMLTNKHIGGADEYSDLPIFPNFFDMFYAKDAEFNFGITYKLTSFAGFVSPIYNSESKVIRFKGPDNAEITTGKFANIATYTGQVGIGIDLNVATTFTSYLYCDDDETGYERIDLNSAEVKKSMVLKLSLPSAITAYNGIDGFVDEDGVVSATPTADYKSFRFTAAEATELNGKSLDAALALKMPNHIENETLLSRYEDEINAFVSNFNGVTDITIEAVLDDNNHTSGIQYSAVFTIANTKDTINKPGYRKELYSAPMNVVSHIPEGETDPVYTLQFNDVDLLDSQFSSVFYVRKAPVAGVQAIMTQDALTNVNWVSTYVGNTVSIVSEQIKGIQTDAYQFSKSLIESLDSSYVSAYGYFIAGIKQENGIVKPIIRELPKDTISAGVEVWGETNSYVNGVDGCKRYEQITKDELIVEEIGAYTALFIENGYNYLPISSEGVNSVVLSTTTEPAANTIQVSINGGENKLIYELEGTEFNTISAIIDTDKDVVASIKCSILAGQLYNGFTQYYFRESAYAMIDPADIKINFDSTSTTYSYTYVLGGNTFNLVCKDEAKVDDSYAYLVKLIEHQPADQKKYISAESFYQAENSNGVGGNSMKVTAHLTKISDASENNSGLVDAYDVRNTLDNLFEWIDLSRWDDGNDTTNPVNTEANEAGGNIEMKQRFIDTKNTFDNPQLGWPVNPVPTPEPTTEPTA